MGQYNSSLSKLNSHPPKGSIVNLSTTVNDIDILFIQSLAKNLKQFDLEHKIDLEVKMREGTTKLLAACKHETQSLEAAKSLLTSNERMNAYSLELQQRKLLEKKHATTKSESKESKQSNKEASSENFTDDFNDDMQQVIVFKPIKNVIEVEPSTARVCVSDIRMPLIWKDVDHFKNRGDYRRFSVFCLLKIGTNIYDTILVNNVDRSVTDISFDEPIIFHDIPSDFELKLEVYSRVMENDLSMASTPKKLKKKISSSVSRTFGRKMAASFREELSDGIPRFDLMAHATLYLKDVNEAISTHELVMINTGNRSSQLPLFGMFCCRLVAQPDCINDERLSGYLRYENGKLYWVSLRNFQLMCWEKSSASIKQEPDLSVDVVRNTLLRKMDDGLSFTLINNDQQSSLFSVINKEDIHLWLVHLYCTIEDHLRWLKAAEKIMSIPNPMPSHVPLFVNERTPGSLYERIPIQEPTKKLGQSFLYSNHDLRSKTSTWESIRSRSPSLSSSVADSLPSTTGRWSHLSYSGNEYFPHSQVLPISEVLY